MSYKTPTRGNMLQLWDKLSPDQGYSREEIEKIARDNAIGDYTVGNLLNTRRKYLILKKDNQLYYRNDSELVAQISTPPKSSASKSAKAKKAKPAASKPVASKLTKSKPGASQSPQSKSTTDKAVESQPVNPLTNIEVTAETIAQKIVESTLRLKDAKLRKEKVTEEKQQLEIEENSLNSEITELEASLQGIQLFL